MRSSSAHRPRHRIFESIRAVSVLVIPFVGRPDGENPAIYRAFFDHAEHGQLVLDHHGMIQRVNPSASRLFGWAEPQLRGRPFADLLAPEARPAFGHALAATRDARPAGSPVPLQGRASDGSTFPIEVEVVRVVRGMEEGYGVIVRDGKGAVRNFRPASARFNPGQLLIASRIQELV